MSPYARQDAYDSACFVTQPGDDLNLSDCVVAGHPPTAAPDAEAFEISCRGLWVTIV
jgi:hypothetical protein